MDVIIPCMTLRLGLIVDSLSVPAWTAQLADRLAALDGVEIVSLISADRSPSAQNTVLESYFALERRFLHNIPDLAHRIDLHRTLPNVSIVSADKVQEIRSQQLDILISFQEVPQNYPSRFGTWAWADISRTAGFHEVLERAPLTTCTLSAYLPDGSTKILRRAVFATDWFSAARNRNHIYIKASSVLVWAIKKLVLQGEEQFFKQPAEPSGSKTNNHGEVNIWGITALALKQVGRGLEKKFRPQETWLLFAGKSAGQLVPNRAATKPILPPQGVYWADPIAFEHDNRSFLFVEEYVRKSHRGRIVCLTLDGEAKVTSHQTALERPYHLSYPFIFEHGGGTYMIPETASQRAIELYRCTHWPDQWELSGALMKNVYAVDTTLFEQGGCWWLFTNMMTEKGASSWDELHLFFSDDPLSSNWTAHPLNPIISDARVARPAGPLFTFNGILYRPSQDSSRRYGYALNLNRVDVLTESDYAETCIEKILPQSGYLATHTYSRAGGWVFMDGVTRKKKEAA